MKIFGVGWPKTGTTTLQKCFKIMGYSHKGYTQSLFENLDQAIRIARRFDTFQDLPWYLYFKELDKVFPGSKFVLTTRNSNRWLRSYRNTVEKQNPAERQALEEVRRKIYGFPFSEAKDDQLIERYERHNSEVAAYFADRPDDLLTVDWEKGDGWRSLCVFLKRPIPRGLFPHENKSSYI